MGALSFQELVEMALRYLGPVMVEKVGDKLLLTHKREGYIWKCWWKDGNFQVNIWIKGEFGQLIIENYKENLFVY